MRTPSITRVRTIARDLTATTVSALCALTATTALAADPGAIAASVSTSASAPAVASDVAGVVKTVKGAVRIERAAGNSAAVIGTNVYSNDRVVTSRNRRSASHCATRPSFPPAPTPRSNSSSSHSSKTYDGALHASVKRGSLAVISGKLAKANPDSVRFSAPTTTLGVRGTQFIIEVGDQAETTH